MTRWDYLSLSLGTGNLRAGAVSHDDLDDLLNRFGEQGWELVSGFDTSSLWEGATVRVVLLLKRPLAEGRRALSGAQKQALLRAERAEWDRRNRYANGELIGDLPGCRGCRMPAHAGGRLVRLLRHGRSRAGGLRHGRAQAARAPDGVSFPRVMRSLAVRPTASDPHREGAPCAVPCCSPPPCS